MSPLPPPPHREELDENFLLFSPSSSHLILLLLLPLLPSASSLEGWVGGADNAGWADGDVIRVRWEAGAWGRVRASVRGQRGRGHGQAREATRRLRPWCFCCWCCYCRHNWHHLQRQQIHIRVASSSENLPLLIKSGGLREGRTREHCD